MTSFRQIIRDLSQAQGPIPLLLTAGRYAIEHVTDFEQVEGALRTLHGELTEAAVKRARAAADLAEDVKFGAGGDIPDP